MRGILRVCEDNDNILYNVAVCAVMGWGGQYGNWYGTLYNGRLPSADDRLLSASSPLHYTRAITGYPRTCSGAAAA